MLTQLILKLLRGVRLEWQDLVLCICSGRKLTKRELCGYHVKGRYREYARYLEAASLIQPACAGCVADPEELKNDIRKRDILMKMILFAPEGGI